MYYTKHDSFVKNLGDVDVIHVGLRKHGSSVSNLGDDVVAHVDYKKHDGIVRNLEDVDVIRVDLQEILSGHEKPRERRSNTRGLRRTWSGPEKPWGR